MPLPPTAVRLHADAVNLFAAATDGIDPSGLPSQLGVAGAVVTPLIAALGWYVRRSEARWADSLQRAEARADRYESRLNELQERAIPLLTASAETNREVLRANGELIQAIRDLERGNRR